MLQITELVGSSDIADIFGVSRSAPGTWERRHAEGPMPYPARVATINIDENGVGTGVWNKEDVVSWGRLTGRLPLEDGRIYDPRTGRDITDKKMMARRKAS